MKNATAAHHGTSQLPIAPVFRAPEPGKRQEATMITTIDPITGDVHTGTAPTKPATANRGYIGPFPVPANWADYMEEWRETPSLTGYEASSLGRVRSVPRVIVRSNGTPQTVRGTVLKPYPNVQHNYLQFRTYLGTKKVHQLVAEAFCGPKPFEDAEARHLNDRRLDNRAINLAWGSRSQNAKDAVRNGVHPQSSKSRCRRRHLLEGANLVPSNARRGGRGCLACSRARSVIKYAKRTGKPELDLQTLADAYYAEILRKAAHQAVAA
jgi:hypothetical protein